MRDHSKIIHEAHILYSDLLTTLCKKYPEAKTQMQVVTAMTVFMLGHMGVTAETDQDHSVLYDTVVKDATHQAAFLKQQADKFLATLEKEVTHATTH